MEENKDETLALQIIYNQPYDQRNLTYEMVKQLSSAMKRPPNNLSTEQVWSAFERLEKDRVRVRTPTRLLTVVVSLVRFGLKKEKRLIPFKMTVDERFEAWLEN